jgi:hypothetical protein
VCGKNGLWDIVELRKRYKGILKGMLSGSVSHRGYHMRQLRELALAARQREAARQMKL